MLTGGIAELKIDLGPGYRVYYCMRDDRLLSLYGGSKATQDEDIHVATKLARQYRTG